MSLNVEKNEEIVKIKRRPPMQIKLIKINRR